MPSTRSTFRPPGSGYRCPAPRPVTSVAPRLLTSAWRIRGHAASQRLSPRFAPPELEFANATDGGQFANGEVLWNVGALDAPSSDNCRSRPAV